MNHAHRDEHVANGLSQASEGSTYLLWSTSRVRIRAGSKCTRVCKVPVGGGANGGQVKRGSNAGAVRSAIRRLGAHIVGSL